MPSAMQQGTVNVQFQIQWARNPQTGDIGATVTWTGPQGQPMSVSAKANERAIKAALMAKYGPRLQALLANPQTAVAGWNLFKSIGKLVHKITHNKIMSSIGKFVHSVTNNPLVEVLVPSLLVNKIVAKNPMVQGLLSKALTPILGPAAPILGPTVMQAMGGIVYGAKNGNPAQLAKVENIVQKSMAGDPSAKAMASLLKVMAPLIPAKLSPAQTEQLSELKQMQQAVSGGFPLRGNPSNYHRGMMAQLAIRAKRGNPFATQALAKIAAKTGAYSIAGRDISNVMQDNLLAISGWQPIGAPEPVVGADAMILAGCASRAALARTAQQAASGAWSPTQRARWRSLPAEAKAAVMIKRTVKRAAAGDPKARARLAAIEIKARQGNPHATMLMNMVSQLRGGAAAGGYISIAGTDPSQFNGDFISIAGAEMAGCAVPAGVAGATSGVDYKLFALAVRILVKARSGGVTARNFIKHVIGEAAKGNKSAMETRALLLSAVRSLPPVQPVMPAALQRVMAPQAPAQQYVQPYTTSGYMSIAGDGADGGDPVSIAGADPRFAQLARRILLKARSGGVTARNFIKHVIGEAAKGDKAALEMRGLLLKAVRTLPPVAPVIPTALQSVMAPTQYAPSPVSRPAYVPPAQQTAPMMPSWYHPAAPRPAPVQPMMPSWYHPKATAGWMVDGLNNGQLQTVSTVEFQQLLKALGAVLTADGVFGQATINALIKLIIDSGADEPSDAHRGVREILPLQGGRTILVPTKLMQGLSVMLQEKNGAQGIPSGDRYAASGGSVAYGTSPWNPGPMSLQNYITISGFEVSASTFYGDNVVDVQPSTDIIVGADGVVMGKAWDGAKWIWQALKPRIGIRSESEVFGARDALLEGMKSMTQRQMHL